MPCRYDSTPAPWASLPAARGSVSQSSRLSLDGALLDASEVLAQAEVIHPHLREPQAKGLHLIMGELGQEAEPVYEGGR